MSAALHAHNLSSFLYGPPVFSSVDLKLVVLRFCKCYYSITYDYHHAQPHSHSHTIGTVDAKVTRTREPAAASLRLITPAFFLFYSKTNAASKQRRKLCNMIRGNFV